MLVGIWGWNFPQIDAVMASSQMRVPPKLRTVVCALLICAVPSSVGTSAAGSTAAGAELNAAAASTSAYAVIGSLAVGGNADLVYVSGGDTASTADDSIYVAFDDTLVTYPPLATSASPSTTLGFGAGVTAVAVTDDSLYVGVAELYVGAVLISSAQIQSFPVGAQDPATPVASVTMASDVSSIAVGGQGTSSLLDDTVYLVAYNGINGISQLTPTLDDSSSVLFSSNNVQPGTVLVSGSGTTSISDDTVYVRGSGFGSGALIALPPALDDSVWRDPLGAGGSNLTLWDDSLIAGSYNGMRIINALDLDDSVQAPLAGMESAVNSSDVIATITYGGGYVPRKVGVIDGTDVSLVTQLDLGYSNSGSGSIAAAADGSFYVAGNTPVVSIVDSVTAGSMSPSSGASATQVVLPLVTASGRLMDDSTVTSVNWGSSAVAFTRVPGQNAVQVSAPATFGSVDVSVVLNGGDELAMGTFAPPVVPARPASPPLDVVAVAGEQQVDVSWSVPADSGTFPITNYQVSSTSGNEGCLASAPAVTCVVSGLADGTSYSFEVRALNGAGWGPWSDASVPVAPKPRVLTSILITGSRGDVRGKPGVVVAGTSTGLGMGAVLRPRVKLAGEASYTQGTASILVDEAGAFTWQRRTGKKAYVYLKTEDGMTRSNRVAISAG